MSAVSPFAGGNNAVRRFRAKERKHRAGWLWFSARFFGCERVGEVDRKADVSSNVMLVGEQIRMVGPGDRERDLDGVGEMKLELRVELGDRVMHGVRNVLVL